LLLHPIVASNFFYFNFNLTKNIKTNILTNKFNVVFDIDDYEMAIRFGYFFSTMQDYSTANLISTLLNRCRHQLMKNLHTFSGGSIEKRIKKTCLPLAQINESRQNAVEKLSHIRKSWKIGFRCIFRFVDYSFQMRFWFGIIFEKMHKNVTNT